MDVVNPVVHRVEGPTMTDPVIAGQVSVDKIVGRSCFVIMPFGKKDTEEAKHYSEVYSELIAPVVAECGFSPIRADELDHTGSITKDVVQHLHRSDLVIADLSERNPNVFYELGVRHALTGRGTVLIAREEERDRLPFDLTNYRVAFYSTGLSGAKEFRGELKKRIVALDGQAADATDNPVHDFLRGELLSRSEFEKLEDDHRQVMADGKVLEGRNVQLSEVNETLWMVLGNMLINTEKLKLLFGENLADLFEVWGGKMVGRFSELRRELITEERQAFPFIEPDYDAALADNRYELRFRDEVLAKGRLLLGEIVAVIPPERRAEFQGKAAIDPFTGRPALLLPESDAERVHDAGGEVRTVPELWTLALKQAIQTARGRFSYLSTGSAPSAAA
jgi:hypothetical protein